MAYVRALPATDLDGSAFARVEIGDTVVLLARGEDGRVIAFGSACPHQGQPMTRGFLTDGVIECPFHFYGYDPETGRNVFPGDDTDTPLPIYRVREDGGWLWVEL